MRRLLGLLLHVANTRPYCLGEREDFYAMKERILNRYGTPAGFDVQFIPGRVCWSCDGTGGLWEQHGCWKCMGDGWYKRPCWVVLRRSKLGGYVFHTPEERSYKRPEPDVTTIEGYVRHTDYPLLATDVCAMLLAIVFANHLWRLPAAHIVKRWWIVRVTTRRCWVCGHRVWSTNEWKCSSCRYKQRLSKWFREEQQEEDVPF